jgi:hypothetical protein
MLVFDVYSLQFTWKDGLADLPISVISSNQFTFKLGGMGCSTINLCRIRKLDYS